MNASMHRYCLFRTSEVPGLATVMAGGENASDKLDTRDGIIEHFLNLTGRKDVEFGELKCASWWRPNIRMVDSLGEGRVFVAGGMVPNLWLDFGDISELDCTQTPRTPIARRGPRV